MTTCGNDVASHNMEALKAVHLSPGERRVLDILLRAHPRPLSQDRIADLLWSFDPNGGPTWARGVVAVHLHRIRQKIAPLGWRAGGVGARSGVSISRIEPRRHNGKANLNARGATLSA